MQDIEIHKYYLRKVIQIYSLLLMFLMYFFIYININSSGINIQTEKAAVREAKDWNKRRWDKTMSTMKTDLSRLDRWWWTSGGRESCGWYRSWGLLMKWVLRLPRQPCAPQCSLQLLLYLLLYLLLQLLLTVVVLDYWRNSRKRWSDWRNLPNCLWNKRLIIRLLFLWFSYFIRLNFISIIII